MTPQLRQKGSFSSHNDMQIKTLQQVVPAPLMLIIDQLSKYQYLCTWNNEKCPSGSHFMTSFDRGCQTCVFGEYQCDTKMSYNLDSTINSNVRYNPS